MLLEHFLNRVITTGRLVVHLPGGSITSFGTSAPGAPSVTVRLEDKATARRIALNPVLGAGEAFMDGRLEILDGDILALLDLVAGSLRWDWTNKNRVALWRSTRFLARFQQLNDRVRAKRNVAHHYDLGNRLYDLFLDKDRQYSCAYFTDPTNDLDVAQNDKLAHIAAKLCLKPGQRVLDIGCGWGGLALYLHRACGGVSVTGITLSEEQLATARKRAAELGVGQHVDFQLLDYRAVTGEFDRIVSVGMFEHVGRPNYQTFFETIRDRLKPDGIALVHTIMRADGPGVTNPFTAKYIFPGGYAPALSEIIPAIERSWLWISDIEVLRLHYAYTIEQWYKRVVAHRAEIESLYDSRFFRMWTFYLASAIVAFRHDGHCNAQIQLTRRRDAAPITRDYMAQAESELRKL